jgi:hypothetical protein
MVTDERVSKRQPAILANPILGRISPVCVFATNCEPARHYALPGGLISSLSSPPEIEFRRESCLLESRWFPRRNSSPEGTGTTLLDISCIVSRPFSHELPSEYVLAFGAERLASRLARGQRELLVSSSTDS